MKKARKALYTLCAALLLVSMTVGVTVAYLTDSDNMVTNTFTTGKVIITMDEAPVDEAGQKTEGDRVQANSYKVYPGGSYDKDPTVHVDPTSETAWLRVKVTFTNSAAADALGLPMMAMFQNINSNLTIGEKQYDANGNVYYIATYNTTVKAGENIVLFDGIEVPSTLTNDELELLNNVQMQIVAYAVQEDGFTSAEASFAAADLGV